MAQDMFAAVEIYLKNRFPVEWAVGEIASVGTLVARAVVNRSGDAQQCSFNNNTVVQRGDTVLLARSKGSVAWTIVQVMNQPRSGNSVIGQPTQNSVPGFHHWASVNIQPSTGGSWSGTTLQDIASATVLMKGGCPMLMYNGYVTPGGSDVQMDIGWGEDYNYSAIWSQTIKTTVGRTAFSIIDTLGVQLVGQHTFKIRAQLGTGGITPTLNCTRFAILEI